MTQQHSLSPTGFRVLWMALSVGALFLSAWAWLRVPCWGLFIPVVLVAWPIWHERVEYRRFQRRTILERVTVEDGWVRRWFWSGHLSGVQQIFVALFWAIVLLVFCAL